MLVFEPLDPAVPEDHIPLDFSVTLESKSSLFFFFFCLNHLEFMLLVPKKALTNLRIKMLKGQGQIAVALL